MLMVGAAFLQLNKVRDACADFLVSRYELMGTYSFSNNGDSDDDLLIFVYICDSQVSLAQRSGHKTIC